MQDRGQPEANSDRGKATRDRLVAHQHAPSLAFSRALPTPVLPGCGVEGAQGCVSEEMGSR